MAFAEEAPQLLKAPGSGLINKLRAYFRPKSADEVSAAESQVLQFSDEEILILRNLGALEISGSINHVYEPDEDETHFWKDKRGRVGAHLKRLDDIDDSVRHTRAFLRSSSDGTPQFLHLLTYLEDEIGVKKTEEVHLRVGRDEVPADIFLEEVDELGFRLRSVQESDSGQIAA